MKKIIYHNSTCSGNSSQLWSTESLHMQQKQRMLLLTKKLNVMASFYPMYDFAVKVGGDCLMLIWQHFGKKEVYYIISAGLGEDIIERSLGDMDGFVEHLEEYRIAGKNYRTHISLWDTLE